MGHRALIAYQNGGTMDWESRYTHWGALDAKLMGTEWDKKRDPPSGSMPGVGRHGKRRTGTYKSLEDWAQDIDFLFHEAAYVVPLDGEARAFDTVWWKGAQEYIPSPGGTEGVGALVELEDTNEWGQYANAIFGPTDDPDGEYGYLEPQAELDWDVTAKEFHEEVKNRWGDRIPDWSPMGGSELRVLDDYLDHGNQQTNAE